MKIGFACKVYDEDKTVERLYNFNTTTVRAMRNLPAEQVRIRLQYLARSNLAKLQALITYVAALPEPLRMLRLSGDLFPLYTHEIAQDAYPNQGYAGILGHIGDAARAAGIRLSFHPGQFVVLGSQRESVVASSLVELEYHAWLLTSMGYSGWHDQGCAINIHAGSKTVPWSVLRHNIGLLSSECRNFLTLENDEFSRGLDELVSEMGDMVAIAPDLHHDWIYEGSYVQPDSGIIDAVVASWRGVRPKMHVAMSREEHIQRMYAESPEWMPDLTTLQALGYTKSKLRQHSDGMWHPALCQYYQQFTHMFDLMVEAKHKQRAARQLYTFFNRQD